MRSCLGPARHRVVPGGRGRALHGGGQGELRADLAQGAPQGGRHLHEPQAGAPDRPGGEQLGRAEEGQVGQQPLVVLLRQVPLAVQAPEQVRRDVVGPQGRGERVQVGPRHRQGRRDPPARERHAERGQGPEDVRDQVGQLPHVVGRDRGAPGQHPQAAEGAGQERGHDRRDAPEREGADVLGRRGALRRRHPDAHGHGHAAPASTPPAASTRTRSSRRTESRRCTTTGCWDRARSWPSSARRPRPRRT